MKFEVGDVVVVTGPLTHYGEIGNVFLTPGEVADVEQLKAPKHPTALVLGRDSGKAQWIDKTSLTPFSEIAEDPEIDWGQVHDYVYEGDDE